MSAATDPTQGSDAQVSPARARANRRNARKSTGPRTPEGKARSSMNAVTHGLCGEQVKLFPGETPEQYWSFRHAMVDALNPRDLAQLALAERAVSCAWRLRRVDGAEATLVRTQAARALVRAVLADDVGAGSPVGRAGAELQAAEDAAWDGRGGGAHRANLVRARQQFDRAAHGRPIEPGEALAMTLVAPGDGAALERLGRYEQRLQNQLHRALRELRVLQQQATDRAEAGEPRGRCPYVPAGFYDGTSEGEAEPAEPSTPVNQHPEVQNEPNAAAPGASDDAAMSCDQPPQEVDATLSGTGVPPVRVELANDAETAKVAAEDRSTT